MSPELVTVVMVGSFFVLLAVGVPLAWAAAAVGLAVGFILSGPDIFPMLVYRIWNTMCSWSLIAVPLFVFMANMLQHSGIADDLYEAFYRWLGPIRGGLAMASVAVCTLVAAMLGTAGAGVTIMGLIALPAMLKRKYDKRLACGSIVAGGSLGVLIPPSIMFIIYGMFAGVSIGKLFMGGILPGLLLSFLYISYIGIRCYLNPQAGPAPSKEERAAITLRLKITATRSLILPILLIVAVLGSIFSGIATPGEAAGVGAIGAMLCAAVRRQFTWQNLKLSLYGTMRTIGLVMWIVFGGMIFITIYTLAGATDFVSGVLFALPLGPWGTLIVIQVILILLGMVLETISIIVLCVPIFVPVITALGFSPLWFGVLFNINLQIAYLSPPFGYSLFYLKGVAPPEISVTDLYLSVWPFIILQLIGLVLCMIFPPIILWLPGMMIK